MINRYFEVYGRNSGIRNTVWCKLFSTDLLPNMRFNETMKQAEDLFFSIDAYAASKSLLLIDRAYYFYNKYEQAKAYYDADIQMAFDRNQYIKDKTITMGVDADKAQEEYCRQVLDTTYDYCMLKLRTNSYDRKSKIHDAIGKMKALDAPLHRFKYSYKQYAVIAASKMISPSIQYLMFLLMKKVADIAHKGA